MVRKHVHYSGRVQGVGFRATTVDVARGFAVNGFVRNLPDGRVELVAEGEPGEIDRFVKAVSDRLGGHIRDAQSSDEPPRGLSDFRIER